MSKIITQEQNELTLEQTRRGNLIAEVLQLNPDAEGRFPTTWGDKTDLGLYKTIKRLIDNGE